MSEEHRLVSPILAGARDEEVVRIIQAIYAVGARRGSVIFACAQVLAESITEAPPIVAPATRAGIIQLIDDCTMMSAVTSA